MSADEARHILVSESDGERIVKDPWIVRIKAGRRRKAWNKNVLAIGLAAGFIEPLESTSIHIITTSVARLLKMFPFDGVTEPVANFYNEMARDEVEHIRDFVCFHYKYNERDDSPFWKECREMEVPETLRERVELFRQGAQLYAKDDELMTIASWFSVLMGQGIEPQTYHHIADLSGKELKDFLRKYHAKVADVVNGLPSHADFVRQYCPANPEAWNFGKA
jgi:tryptophan halogenase